MPASVQELIEYCLINSANLSEGKAKIVAARFGDLKTFLQTSGSTYKELSFVGGRKVNLSEKDLTSIVRLQKSKLIDAKLTPQQNFIKILGMEFLNKQIRMINALRLEDLNANPILISSLKLTTPESMIKFYVYQAVARSIVTSMGYLVQDLILHSGPDIFDGKTYASKGGTKWDFVKIVKRGLKETMSWVEVKSGPNDMDKAQILYYKKMIEGVERRKERGFIGETYGKRSTKTVTHGLYGIYLEDWEKRTLIGKELWTFVSGDPNYPSKLVELLKDAADRVLLSKTILEEIDQCVIKIQKEFRGTYGNSKDSVSRYLNSLW